jgi:uncharacterized OB-fold protein
VNGVVLSVCPACHWRGFPERLWCPRCGSFQLEQESVDDGIVEEVTRVYRAAGRPRPSRAVVLGEVLVHGVAPVVARIEGAMASGDPARLETQAGAVLARHATCNDGA